MESSATVMRGFTFVATVLAAVKTIMQVTANVETSARVLHSLGTMKLRKDMPAQEFPSLQDVLYQNVISKCWRSKYSANMLKRDILRHKLSSRDWKPSPQFLLDSTLAMIGMGYTIICIFGRRRMW